MVQRAVNRNENKHISCFMIFCRQTYTVSVLQQFTSYSYQKRYRMKTLNIFFPYSWEYCVQMLSIFKKPSSKKGKKQGSSGLIYTWFLVQNGMKKLAFFCKTKKSKSRERRRGYTHLSEWVESLMLCQVDDWADRTKE